MSCEKKRRFPDTIKPRIINAISIKGNFFTSFRLTQVPLSAVFSVPGFLGFLLPGRITKKLPPIKRQNSKIRIRPLKIAPWQSDSIFRSLGNETELFRSIFDI